MYYNKLPHGIMFHHFHNEKYIPSRGSISGDDLKKLLEYIGKQLKKDLKSAYQNFGVKLIDHFGLLNHAFNEIAAHGHEALTDLNFPKKEADLKFRGARHYFKK